MIERCPTNYSSIQHPNRQVHLILMLIRAQIILFAILGTMRLISPWGGERTNPFFLFFPVSQNLPILKGECGCQPACRFATVSTVAPYCYFGPEANLGHIGTGFGNEYVGTGNERERVCIDPRRAPFPLKIFLFLRFECFKSKQMERISRG